MSEIRENRHTGVIPNAAVKYLAGFVLNEDIHFNSTIERRIRARFFGPGNARIDDGYVMHSSLKECEQKINAAVFGKQEGRRREKVSRLVLP